MYNSVRIVGADNPSGTGQRDDRLRGERETAGAANGLLGDGEHGALPNAACVGHRGRGSKVHEGDSKTQAYGQDRRCGALEEADEDTQTSDAPGATAGCAPPRPPSLSFFNVCVVGEFIHVARRLSAQSPARNLRHPGTAALSTSMYPVPGTRYTFVYPVYPNPVYTRTVLRAARSTQHRHYVVHDIHYCTDYQVLVFSCTYCK